MQLTNEQYFTPENNYLSNSKISDYLKSPEYFYKRHITKELGRKESDAFLIGKACDIWLTEGKEKFLSKYVCVDRRNLKNPPTVIVELNNSQYNLIIGMCESVEKTPAYQEVKNHKSQQIFFEDFKIGEYFSGLCGIPDWYDIQGDICYITDLKTTMSVDEKKYHWSCLEHGYYRQQAMYQRLIKHKHPEIKKFVSRHLSVEKSYDEYYDGYRVMTFELSQDSINLETEVIDTLIEEIANRKDFINKPICFSNAKEIGGRKDYDF